MTTPSSLVEITGADDQGLTPVRRIYFAQWETLCSADRMKIQEELAALQYAEIDPGDFQPVGETDGEPRRYLRYLLQTYAGALEQARLYA